MSDDTQFDPAVAADAASGTQTTPWYRRRRTLWWVGAVLLVVAAGWWIHQVNQNSLAKQRRAFGMNGPMAVAVATATSGDLDLILPALGTVAPLATVTVKTQISGQLQQLAFKEGQLVKKGDFLAQIDPRPYQAALEQVRGNLLRDQALLANARVDLKRYIELVAQDSIASQQLDTQQALVQQYEGTVINDKAQLASAELNLQYTHIVSPVSGRVGLRQVDQGNYVTPGDVAGIVVVTQLQPISVVFPMPEDNLPAVQKRVHAGAALTVQAFDRSNTTQLGVGTLDSLDNQIDTTTGTLKMRALFDNKDAALFANQFVNVRLLVDVLRDQVIIPIAAVQHGASGGPNSTFVYLVGPDSTVSVHPVVLGTTEGERVAVASGLKPGDIVVTEGGDRLRDGAKVLLPKDTPQPQGGNPARKRDPSHRKWPQGGPPQGGPPQGGPRGGFGGPP